MLDPGQTELKVGDLVWVTVGGQLVFDEPRRIEKIYDRLGLKWFVVEGSDSGLPADHFQRADDAEAAALPKPLAFACLPAAFNALKTRRQWVAWRYQERTNEDGEVYLTKPPINPHNHRHASVSNPKTWGTYDEALTCALRHDYPGVGYVLIANDIVSGSDLDKVRDPVTGALADFAQTIVDLAESYVEISPSGRGLRQLWLGQMPAAIKQDDAQVEIYSTGRYLTVTGQRIEGTPDELRPAPKTLALLQARVAAFRAKAKDAKDARAADDEIPREGGTRQREGEEKAKQATSGFWRAVKDAALADLADWVPALFPQAIFYSNTGAYRITSQQLGRDLEEDFSIYPDGIMDWGTRMPWTVIDLVMDRRGGTDKDAAFWLCDRMGVTPASLGWTNNNDSDILRPYTQPAGAAGPATPGIPADEARELSRNKLNELMAEALAFLAVPTAREDGRNRPDASEPPHSAVQVTTGAGKSDYARAAMALHFIPEAKRQELPYRVLKLVGTHALADEASKKMPGNVTVALWQGRASADVVTKEPMCLNLPAVEAALAIGADVESAACRRKPKGQEAILCPFYDQCRYQKQKLPALKADVVYAAHEIAFSLPEALGEFGLLVLDEAWWPKGLRGTLPKSPRLLIDSLADDLKDAPVRDKSGRRLDDDTADLRGLYERLQSAFDKMPDGYVTRQPLIEAGLQRATVFDRNPAGAAADLEWARKNINADLLPGASEDARKRAVENYGALKRVAKRAALWSELDALIDGTAPATGRVRLETAQTENGSQRVVRVLRRKPLAKRLLGLPIIVLDATLPFELVKSYLPNLKLALHLDVAAPHMHATQVAARGLGKSSLQPLPEGKRTPEEEERVTRKRKTLADTCRHLTQGRTGLIIAQKDIEPDFTGIDGVTTAHFGDIEGRDIWKDVGTLITIGRPLPSPQAIEYMAAAVTGKPVIAGKTVTQWRPIGNTGQALKCRVYADPDADLIRQAVTEAAIVQAVGRARGVNRTQAKAVEVFAILGDTVAPGLPVDAVLTLADIQPDAVDLMIARQLIPEIGADAAKLHPDLFPNPEAAKKAYQRAYLDVAAGTRRRYRGQTGGRRFGTSPYKTIFIRECPEPLPLTLARYKITGPGQRPRLLQICIARYPNPRVVLEAALGPLAMFEWLDTPESAQAAE